jgi:hypothetical protein
MWYSTLAMVLLDSFQRLNQWGHLILNFRLTKLKLLKKINLLSYFIVVMQNWHFIYIIHMLIKFVFKYSVYLYNIIYIRLYYISQNINITKNMQMTMRLFLVCDHRQPQQAMNSSLSTLNTWKIQHISFDLCVIMIKAAIY